MPILQVKAVRFRQRKVQIVGSSGAGTPATSSRKLPGRRWASVGSQMPPDSSQMPPDSSPGRLEGGTLRDGGGHAGFESCLLAQAVGLGLSFRTWEEGALPGLLNDVSGGLEPPDPPSHRARTQRLPASLRLESLPPSSRGAWPGPGQTVPGAPGGRGQGSARRGRARGRGRGPGFLGDRGSAASRGARTRTRTQPGAEAAGEQN